MQTRAEWQAEQDEVFRRTGAWGFNPSMPWHVANWRERSGIVLFYAIGWGVVFPGMFVGATLLIGPILDGIERHSAEQERCLKNATNGYEIRQCR